MFDKRQSFDAVTSDPTYYDRAFPPEQFVTHFLSQGSVVHATVWIAQGASRKGTVILSPQVFGGDRLESLIIPMLGSGMNVLTFHPRGMWDNQHVYSLSGAVDDALAAAAFVAATATDNSETLGGHPWRIDPARIAVMGLSGGGGNVALATCAESEHIHSAIAIAANSMAAPGTLELRQMFARLPAMTAGRIDVEAMMETVTPEQATRLSPIAQASRLADKNILLVGASLDSVAPVETCHCVIVRALQEAGSKTLCEVVLESDHSFLTARIALARLVIGWLRAQCGF